MNSTRFDLPAILNSFTKYIMSLPLINSTFDNIISSSLLLTILTVAIFTGLYSAEIKQSPISKYGKTIVYTGIIILGTLSMHYTIMKNNNRKELEANIMKQTFTEVKHANNTGEGFDVIPNIGGEKGYTNTTTEPDKRIGGDSQSYNINRYSETRHEYKQPSESIPDTINSLSLSNVSLNMSNIP